MANTLNTLNLIQVKGGVNIKQGDSTSILEYELGYTNNSNTMVDPMLDGKAAKVTLYNRLANKKYTKDSVVEGNRVSFTIDEALELGVYVVDIDVAGHIFPSDREMYIRIYEGYQSYMDGRSAVVAVATAKNIANEGIRQAIAQNLDKIKGPKGDRGYTGPQGPVGPQGPQGVASKVTSSKYDSSGNTIISFNNGSPDVTVQRGKQGLKGDTGNPVNVSSVTKSGTMNTVKFTDGKTMIVEDGKSVNVSSTRILDDGNTEIVFTDGKKAIVKKGQDGTVKFDELTEEQRKSLQVDVVDDLTTGGSDKALSAEQGKEINAALADLVTKIANIKDGYKIGDFIQLGNLKAVVEGELSPVKDWEFTGNSSSVNSVAVDGEGNVYSASNDKVFKISPSGSKIWEFTEHTNWVNSVAVDGEGNVYSGGADNKVMKISPSGSKIWEFTGHANFVNSVAVDEQGNVYSGSGDKKVMKISSSGSKIWEFTGHTGSARSVAVDGEGNVYSGARDNKVMKISPSGSKIWEFTGHAGVVWCVTVDGEGNVYSGGSDNKVMKISPSGSKIWEFTGHTGSVSSVAVDDQGNVYSGGGDKKVMKIKQEGDRKIVGYEVIK